MGQKISYTCDHCGNDLDRDGQIWFTYDRKITADKLIDDKREFIDLCLNCQKDMIPNLLLALSHEDQKHFMKLYGPLKENIRNI